MTGTTPSTCPRGREVSARQARPPAPWAHAQLSPLRMGTWGDTRMELAVVPQFPNLGVARFVSAPLHPFTKREGLVSNTPQTFVNRSLTSFHRGSPRLSIEQECKARGESGPCAQLDDGRYDDGTCCCPAVPGYVVFMYPCGTCLFIFV